MIGQRIVYITVTRWGYMQVTDPQDPEYLARCTGYGGA